jgi:predicted enzyme related to lactoylglutathione lyase
MGEGQPAYTEFLLDGQSVADAREMNPMVPAEVPSYWRVYFAVDDVDGTFRKAIEAGAREMLPPQDFPGGRFTIVSDPQGASSRTAQDRATLIDPGGRNDHGRSLLAACVARARERVS